MISYSILGSSQLCSPLFFFKKKIFIYLFIHKRHREGGRHRQRKKQAPCREPNVGLDSGTPGSRPEPQADAQPLSHPGAPLPHFIDEETKTQSKIPVHTTNKQQSRDSNLGSLFQILYHLKHKHYIM